MRTTTPPGWYPDWDNPELQRYWDGAQWTDQVAPHQQGTPLTPSPRPSGSSDSRRTMWLAAGGVALLVAGIAIGAVAADGDDDPGTSATGAATVTVTAGPGEAPPADGDTGPSRRFPKQDGDWQLESLQVTADDDGTFAGEGEVTYTGGDEGGGDGSFTVTLVNNAGDVVATMGAFITDVEPGQTVTIAFSGADPYKPGTFRSTFQLDQ